MIQKEDLSEELIKEIASTGGDYGRKLEEYMKELHRLKSLIDYLELRIRRNKKLPMFSMMLVVRLRKRFNRLKREAIEVRRNLIIYREALGLFRHREVFEIYNIESINLD